jgi:predicted Ser/Thr protein kinase
VSLSEGTRLGPFEISGQLGAGGMGEVYRARDTKLGREVAIKTLPASLAGDADRLARFEREARLLAALNHANIASVYNLDEQDGTLFIAMELVEGESLEARLRRGALSVNAALQCALQIAQALEAAHDKGVVHRDLKPANIMITPDGVVKVLDFGLAKAFSGDPNEASPAHSPALSVAMTQAGLVLGTAGYMSPEQASGQATDQRADVWAFGVVVYEMLTGIPVFHGESVPHILAAVLQLEPDWSRLPKDLHPRIRFMLERCLTKKPRNRYVGIADARADIEAVISDPGGASVASVAGAPQTTAWSKRHVAIAAGVLLVVAALSAGAVWLGLTPDTEPPRVTRFNIEPPAGSAELRATNGALVALSRDGRRLSINTGQGIYIRELDQLESRLIPGTEDARATGPFFSFDGRSLGFGGGLGVRRISVDGGRIVPMGGGLISGEGNCGFASPGYWIDNETMLAFCNREPRGFVRVHNDGTHELLLPWTDDGAIIGWSWLLPDGHSVLFSMRPTSVEGWDAGDVRVVSLDTGESKVLITGGGIARYLSTGHLVFVRDDVLYGVGFDLETLSVTSAEEPLILNLHRSRNAEASFSTSDNGTLVYVVDRTTGETPAGPSPLGATRLDWVGGDGGTTPISADGGFVIQPRLSPDGLRLAFTRVEIDRADRSATADIWIRDLERGGAPVPLQPRAAGSLIYSPLWMPDGESILYVTQEGVMRRRADGTGDATTIWAAPAGQVSAGVLLGITPDASEVLLQLRMQDSQIVGLFRLPLTEGSEPELLLDGSFNRRDAALSPDGRWLAYASDESGVDQVFVVPYPDVDTYRVPVSTDGGTEPLWDPTRNSLYFRDGNDLLGADYETEPRFSVDVPIPVIAGTFVPFGEVPGLTMRNLGPSYSVTPDGSRFVLNRPDDELDEDAAPLEIVVVENWFEELKQRIPTE